MRPIRPGLVVHAALLVAGWALSAAAQQQPAAGMAEIQTVTAAREALDQFGGLQIESIPQTMLEKAEGVAIFPNMIKGGFILGVNYGRGVLMVRRPDRTWSPPVMVTMGGGSLGFQAGVQAADIVLVFATPRSLQGILAGQKVTLGADASVALGPVGRQANAGTDARLGAEIYSYARSRGLFLGVSLGGADLSVDHNANSMLYGRFGVTPADVFEARGLAFHQEVKQLIDDLNGRTRPATVPPAAAATGALQPLERQTTVPIATQPTTMPMSPISPAVPAASPVPSAAQPITMPMSPIPGSQAAPALPVMPGAPALPPGTPPLVPIR
jgi:lipid-binding SYLF domain-containing protein